MRICRLDEPLPAELTGAVVALGNFDGVHRGHQAVIAEGRRMAKAEGRQLGVMAFEPHPRNVFRPDDPPFRLTSLTAKARLLGGLGVNVLYVLPFDRELAKTPALVFIDEFLVGRLHAAHVVCGHDFVFGHQRGGDAALLEEVSASRGFAVTVVAPSSGPEGNRFSSSGVRAALQEGDLDRAIALLGRDWEIEGEVIEGDRRGRTIGFPTANIALGDYLLPKRGVYAVRACVEDGNGALEGRWLEGAANVGLRPTVDGKRDSLEVHLLDFNGDLYGRTLRVRFVAWLRGEERFDGLDALKRQIARDCEAARRSLAPLS
ncbi:MAG: bifunctional riboflavin kinase/FAD synthetase [Acetobacterales bacterium]